MPDITLRFHKDMLVLSSSVLAALERAGVDVRRDAQLTTLLEPDTIEDIHRMEALTGVQCLVANTSFVTPVRLRQCGMEDRANDLVDAALAALAPFSPQHVLAEIAPCGLPLDGSSKSSLNENRDQYARAARLFAGKRVDALFLNGFATTTDLKCALMGVRQVSDLPVFASVDVRGDGTLASGRGTWAEAVAVMGEYGATVAGFSTDASAKEAAVLAKQASESVYLPLLVQLSVRKRDPRQQAPAPENPYYVPDTMLPAAETLRRAGVQFLRATGDATPAYTGALVAATLGLDAQVGVPAKDVADEEVALADLLRASDQVASGSDGVSEEKMAVFIQAARARVDEALSGHLEIVECDGPKAD